MVDFTAINIGAAGFVGIFGLGFAIYVHRGAFEREYEEKVNQIVDVKKVALNCAVEELHELHVERREKEEDSEFEVAGQKDANLINEIVGLGNMIQDTSTSIAEGKLHLRNIFMSMTLVGVLFLIIWILAAYAEIDLIPLPATFLLILAIAGAGEWLSFDRITKTLEKDFLESKGIKTGL